MWRNGIRACLRHRFLRVQVPPRIFKLYIRLHRLTARIQDSQSCDMGSNPIAVIRPCGGIGIRTRLRTGVLRVQIPSRIFRRIRLNGKDKRLSISKYGFKPRIRHKYGQVCRMVKAADCKSVTLKRCRFKSYSAHLIWSHKPNLVRQRFAKPRVTAFCGV